MGCDTVELLKSALNTHTHTSVDMSHHHPGVCTDVCMDTTRFIPQAFAEKRGHVTAAVGV